MVKYRVPTDKELENIRDYLMYFEGNLYAKKSYANNKIKAGQRVGSLSENGYLRVGCMGRRYKAHRVIYYLCKGVWPIGVVDHINGDPSDNRIENLRDISQAENLRSFRKVCKGSSSYRGVSAFRDRWQSEISYCGKKYRLGYFTCEKEAALAYNYKAMELGFNKEAFNKVFED